MKPVRLAISLFVIELFIIFWIWLRYDDSFNPKAFVAIACISAVVFIAITTIITLFPKKTGLMQNQVFKEMPRPEDFLPGKPAQDKDATDGDSMDEDALDDSTVEEVEVTELPPKVAESKVALYKRKMARLRKRQPMISKMIYFVDGEKDKPQKDGIISDNTNDYIIETNDLDRANDYDPDYNNKYREVLFHLYDYHCPLCQENPCEHLDHFFIPKCKGGNFIMVTTKGDFVNNAVPLCSTCNLKKGMKSYKEFFTPKQLGYISHRNAIMTAVLRKRF